jgi:hypothetical protein
VQVTCEMPVSPSTMPSKVDMATNEVICNVEGCLGEDGLDLLFLLVIFT